jgi:hypothetical protein
MTTPLRLVVISRLDDGRYRARFVQEVGKNGDIRFSIYVDCKTRDDALGFAHRWM